MTQDDHRRYVVIGGGAVGGALVAQLAGPAAPVQVDVVLVARGDHGRRIAEHGLAVHRPIGTDVVRVEVVAGPEELDLLEDDVLVLTVKTQDAEAALAEWAWQPVLDADGDVVGSAAGLPIVTFQNGLLTEDLALRRFDQVYGATIAIAASYLTPGEVVSPSLPPAVGAIWLGRHPGPARSGPDPLLGRLVDDLVAGGFAAWAVPDIGAVKAAKLLGNVVNGLDLLEGPDDLRAEARSGLRAEAATVLRAAGTELPPSGELDFHGTRMEVLPVEGHTPGRFSTWQSFARGASSEIDYLNGEIVLLARRAGVAAPLNERLQQLLAAPHLADERTLESLLTDRDAQVAV